jgi:hypothetical protein
VVGWVVEDFDLCVVGISANWKRDCPLKADVVVERVVTLKCRDRCLIAFGRRCDCLDMLVATHSNARKQFAVLMYYCSRRSPSRCIIIRG